MTPEIEHLYEKHNKKKNIPQRRTYKTSSNTNNEDILVAILSLAFLVPIIFVSIWLFSLMSAYSKGSVGTSSNDPFFWHSDEQRVDKKLEMLENNKNW